MIDSPDPAQRWEYETAWCTPAEMRKTLAGRGRQGWRLMHVLPPDALGTGFIFERSTQPPPFIQMPASGRIPMLMAADMAVRLLETVDKKLGEEAARELTPSQATWLDTAGRAVYAALARTRETAVSVRKFLDPPDGPQPPEGAAGA